MKNLPITKNCRNNVLPAPVYSTRTVYLGRHRLEVVDETRCKLRRMFDRSCRNAEFRIKTLFARGCKAEVKLALQFNTAKFDRQGLKLRRCLARDDKQGAQIQFAKISRTNQVLNHLTGRKGYASLLNFPGVPEVKNPSFSDAVKNRASLTIEKNLMLGVESEIRIMDANPFDYLDRLNTTMDSLTNVLSTSLFELQAESCFEASQEADVQLSDGISAMTSTAVQTLDKRFSHLQKMLSNYVGNHGMQSEAIQKLRLLSESLDRIFSLECAADLGNVSPLQKKAEALSKYLGDVSLLQKQAKELSKKIRRFTLEITMDNLLLPAKDKKRNTSSISETLSELAKIYAGYETSEFGSNMASMEKLKSREDFVKAMTQLSPECAGHSAIAANISHSIFRNKGVKFGFHENVVKKMEQSFFEQHIKSCSKWQLPFEYRKALKIQTLKFLEERATYCIYILFLHLSLPNGYRRDNKELMDNADELNTILDNPDVHKDMKEFLKRIVSNLLRKNVVFDKKEIDHKLELAKENNEGIFRMLRTALGPDSR